MRPWIKLLGLALALVASLILLGAAFTRPRPPSLSTTVTGSAEAGEQRSMVALHEWRQGLPLTGQDTRHQLLISWFAHVYVT